MRKDLFWCGAISVFNITGAVFFVLPSPLKDWAVPIAQHGLFFLVSLYSRLEVLLAVR